MYACMCCQLAETVQGGKEHSEERVVFMANCDIEGIVLSGPNYSHSVESPRPDCHSDSVKLLYKSFEL